MKKKILKFYAHCIDNFIKHKTKWGKTEIDNGGYDRVAELLIFLNVFL